MKRLYVWDPLVRIFHWSFAGLFLTNALLTDPESRLHEQVGYALLALLALRLVWGVAGPRFARFASFAPSLAAVTGQVTDLATRRRRVHLGHTPLGAVMIFNLLFSVAAIGATGWMMTTTAFWGVEWVEEAHEVLVGWAELSVAVHVLAVLFESARTGVNLVAAMITGVKRVPGDASIAP